MATRTPDSEQLDYESAEGLDEAGATHIVITAEEVRHDRARREWLMIGFGLAVLVAFLALVTAVFVVADDKPAAPAVAAPAAPVAKAPAAPAAANVAPTLADAKGIAFEKFTKVDPTLPPIPPGAVKKFKVDVLHHVTQVSKDLAPTEIWSFAINGKVHRGTGVSGPMVVTEGDTVDFTLVNGSTKAMKVTMPHSMDFHSAEVNPGKRYADLAPGKSMHYRFVADHPGVFMYHCATQPVLMHTGMGMVGMFVVKPKNLAPVDKELWMTQQEYYLGAPGKGGDMAKMEAKKPDVIAFNGYANQYKDNPITVKKGERVRMYVLNAGPSIWSAFHVIGTVFDRTVVEGRPGADSQTMNLAPSQGGWAEFTLDEEGGYPFVTHAFADAGKGAIGVLQTEHAPKAAAGHDMGGSAAHAKPAAAAADVDVSLGDMWIKASAPTVKAGKVTFGVKNEGATMHGVAIASAPVKLEAGMVDHSTIAGKGGELGAGASETVSADLKPGKYELICHITGHYQAGQKLPFEVTS
ncbi:MAG TPA: multicopper oxidase domain-containing protein [Solirubrobacteraceae bacterium]|nr:multicopper oxidase domain-containing protein [Solirubrobacteraceae bacterium]